ncbi:MAG: FG-GAP-like repeat-containing protein [Sandaracinaceae bacterium]
MPRLACWSPLLAVLLVACAGDGRRMRDDAGDEVDASSPPPLLCGNGVADPGEACDGDCPDACNDGVACTSDELSGAADRCDAQCRFEAIVVCVDDDGCCAPGCDATSDSDCSASCGNGTLEPPERCDGDCPEACNDGVACTADALTGSAQACSAACAFSPIGTCADDDGCCPAGCDVSSDNDCSATCGNGTIEAPEICDGDCPTACDDGLACTTDSLVGDAASCSASCAFAPIVECNDGDGCCAPGCDATLDADCSPSCGNGVTEGTELCDGDCPTACDDGLTCTTDTLVGAASSCSVSCSFAPITACVDGDGCCAPGCDATLDSDCSPSCGNGVTEPPEECDADCPSGCDDGLACTTDTLVGSSVGCSATCSFTAIDACVDDDGCCPSGCDFTSDRDCDPVVPETVLVNEVLYDATGADAPLAFIELHAPPGTDLSGYSVVGVNGSGAGDYVSIPLAGSVGADGLFVIAHPSAGDPLASLADQLDAGADLQNGPDSVQVRYAGIVVDALGYGDFAGATFAGEAPAAVASPEGMSLTRDVLHTDTDRNLEDFALATPSPGADEACTSPTAPRLVAPLSTSRVTRGGVPFRWALPPGHDGARVEVCTDRACTSVVTTFDATGEAGSPAAALPAGNYYWRAYGRCDGSESTESSPVWQFSVAHGARGAFSSWNQPFDINGDFHADALITQAPDRRVRYYTGNGSGLLHQRDFDGIFGVGPVDAGGDIDGDGYGDALIADSAGVRVYLGGPAGLPETRSGRGRASSIRDVAGLGDINGDGYADFGAITASSGSQLALFFGGVSLPTAPSEVRPVSSASSATVGSVGDVNADGYADVLVTNCAPDRPGCGGDAYVYLGGPGGLSSAPAWALETGGTIRAHGGGDLDGDGYSDVVVSDLSAVQVFLGGPSGPSPTANRTLSAPSSAVSFGDDLVLAGDLNGDGFDDLVVGDPDSETVWLYWGPALSLASTVSRAGDHDFGEVLAIVGDVEADGRDDVLVAAPDAPMPATWESVRLFSGLPTGISATSGGSQTLRGTARNRSFGRHLR